MNDDAAAAALRPPPGPLADQFWQSLTEGRLTFQRCRHCKNSWLPVRSECPSCLHADWTWEEASGAARLISWVVYHRAFNEAFAKRLPYTVAVVELDEGPRMTSNIVGVDDPETLKIDQRLRLRIEQDFGMAVPRFTPA
jgi:uncharacterized OB-fold protein